MHSNQPIDWNPNTEAVRQDQIAAYDEMREQCPVALSESRGWSIFRHRDVMRILNDHQSFSNAVSQHLSVPNGMDPPEHTLYRQLIEPCFTAQRINGFAPTCRTIADEVIDAAISSGEDVEVMSQLAATFAARAQCAFLGWPDRLYHTLMLWTARNQQATRDSDRPELSILAREFEAIVAGIIDSRRTAEADPRDDITSFLMRQQVGERPLSNEELSSIFRNWTVGEIGTLSASIGILLEYLAEHDPMQTQLRRDGSRLPHAIDEILRVHNPLVNNRRRTTCPVTIGDRQMEAGESISINWISANRDEQVFDDANQVRLDRDPSMNLLYGAGIHVCPGAPLARMELQTFVDSLFQRTLQIAPQDAAPAVLETYPASGFSSLKIRMVATTT